MPASDEHAALDMPQLVAMPQPQPHAPMVTIEIAGRSKSASHLIAPSPGLAATAVRSPPTSV
jgi:hypothetical protein